MAQMANRAYLLNVPTLTGDPYLLQERLSQGPAAHYAEIAEVSNRIPLPWLCCFRGAKLTEVHGPSEFLGEEAESDEFIVTLPCIEVAAARKNVHAGLETFQQMAGDAMIGEGYWRRACAGLEGLALPYLAMDPLEVLLQREDANAAAQLSACFKPPWPSLEVLKSWSGYRDGFAPFRAEDFYSRPVAELDHVARLESSRALDAGYLGQHCFWHRHTPTAQGGQSVNADAAAATQNEAESATGRPRPWWRIWLTLDHFFQLPQIALCNSP